MKIWRWRLRGSIAALLLALAAQAGSDPYPGEGVAPPPDINIVLIYNRFSDAGSYASSNGSTYSHNTRISTDSAVVRYIRTFSVGNMVGGVQAVGAYTAFLGNQEIGTANIPGLRGLPSYGAGHAAMTAKSGFPEPLIGAFLFPYSNPKTGTNLVIAPWIGVPLGSYSGAYNLNPTSNLWTFELETGLRTILLGTPNGRNLALELWGEGYLFGSNGDAAVNTPAVYANNIPTIYDTLNLLTHGLVPDSNPLRAASAVHAKLEEQPSAELRIYLPYEFYPATHAMVAPGLFQSFGGKQTYTLSNGTKEDAGTRTQTTQLRFVISSFISPHVQLMLAGTYDLIAHGAPVNRGVMLRIGTFF